MLDQQEIEDQVRVRLRERRSELGWSIDDLAAHSLLSASTISRIETGKRRPGLNHLVPLANALGLSLEGIDLAGDASLRVDARQVEVEMMTLRGPGGAVEAHGRLPLAKGHAWDLEARATGLDLSHALAPHGVPLQGGLAKLRRKHGAVPLSDVETGRTVEVLCVYEKDSEFLRFLSGLTLHPGARARIKKREYDETMTLAVGQRTIHLGKPATSRIWVRQVPQ